MIERREASGLHRAAAAMAAPLALGLVGVAMWGLSQGQPARLGDAIGPGFMAQWLARGIVVLALLWAAVTVRRGKGAGAAAAPRARTAQRGAGLALLGGVLVFVLVVPVAGLVAGAALAAGCAAWAAGERRARALALAMLALAGLAGGIGLMLLPPTAPLWPRG